MTQLAIQASEVTRRFGSYTAVDRLSLQIPRGCIYGFLGPNGSGKSTSIRLLTGLLTPDSGRISILGYELPRHAEELRSHIGYMTQRFSLFGDLTLSENLLFIARIHGLRRNEINHRIDELLETYELADRRDLLADSLSGGQKQRLALAAATIHKPELLFLDEPTSAVDPENRRDFWEKLFDLSDAGTTILVSTHYMDEAERCHYLAILETGIKRADDTPQNLMLNMDATVVEIGGPDLRQLKKTLLRLPHVKSVAQQGIQLRVLIDKSIQDPIEELKSMMGGALTSYHMAIVRPSLEDVFVTSTGGRHP